MSLTLNIREQRSWKFPNILLSSLNNQGAYFTSDKFWVAQPVCPYNTEFKQTNFFSDISEDPSSYTLCEKKIQKFFQNNSYIAIIFCQVKEDQALFDYFITSWYNLVLLYFLCKINNNNLVYKL